MDHFLFALYVISNHCLYRKSVICFNIEKYSVDENIIFMVKSYDDNYYICAPCDKALRKNSVSCQAVVNVLNSCFKTFVDLKDWLHQEGFCLKR